MKLRKSQSEWCWVNFHYKGVPTFCFICGMIGHGEKIFDTPLEEIEKFYGVWMRAEPRRRNHTMGAKWLRQGGKNPVSFPVATTADSEGGIIATKSAVITPDPMKVGNKTDMAVNSKKIMIGGTSGTGENLGDNNAIISNNILTGKMFIQMKTMGCKLWTQKNVELKSP